MTVPSTTTFSGPFVLNAVAVTFGYGFKILDEDDIEFLMFDPDTGELTVADASDYTVTDVGNVSGGNVVFDDAPGDAGTPWTGYVRRKGTMTQGVSLTDVGAFFPSVVMGMVDRLTMFVQELREEADRSVRFSIGEVIGSLPAAEFRVNKFMAFDENGDLTLAGSAVPSSDFMTPAVQADTIAEVITALGGAAAFRAAIDAQEQTANLDAWSAEYFGNYATTAAVTAMFSNSPALGGNPTATTQTAGNNSTRLATTAFVQTAIGDALDAPGSLADLIAGFGGGAAVLSAIGAQPQSSNLDDWSAEYFGNYATTAAVTSMFSNSPALGGNPTAATQAAGNNSTRIATTAFVQGEIGGAGYVGATQLASDAVTTAKILNNNVTLAKVQQIATDRILGRDTAGTGNVEELTVGGGIEFTGAGGLQRSAFAGGDVTASAGSAVLSIASDAVTTAKILNNNVTLAKVQQITTDRLLGRDTASTGDVEQITVGGGIEFTGAGGIQRSALTGDVTASAGSNAMTIAANAVTFAKMQTIATDSLLGRDTAGTGAVENITLNGTLEMSGAGVLRRAAISGDVVIAAGSNSAAIANDAVTYAKMQNVSATDRLLGRDTASAGDVEELTVGGGVEFTGAGGIQRSALTGDVTATAGSNATSIAANAVTTAKIADANVTLAKLASSILQALGNSSGVSGTISVSTSAPSGGADGDIWLERAA